MLSLGSDLYHVRWRKALGLTPALGWSKVISVSLVGTREAPLSWGPAVGSEACTHCMGVLQPLSDRSKCEHRQGEMLQRVKERFLRDTCQGFLNLTPKTSRDRHWAKHYQLWACASTTWLMSCLLSLSTPDPTLQRDLFPSQNTAW